MHHRLVAWLLDRLYNECAALYTSVAMCVSHGHWFLWGEAVIPFLSAPVLEVGCGQGRLLSALGAQGIDAIGIDRSAAMLRRAAPHLTRIRADARAIPCPDAAFATVVAVFPTPYIADPATISEIDRVLCISGRLVILLSAGNQAVTAHPLWSAYREKGWALEQRVTQTNNQPLQIIVATRQNTTTDATDH